MSIKSGFKTFVDQGRHPVRSLRASPDLLLFGDLYGRISIKVPGTGALLGAKFYMQRADLTVTQYIDSNCKRYFVGSGFRGFSDGVEGTVGR